MAAVGLACALAALALGAFSSLFFTWQWIAGAPTTVGVALLLTATVAAAGSLFVRLRRRMTRIEGRSGGIWLFAALAGAYVAYGLVRHARANPHGAWDAWAIWNLHARFLHRGANGGWTEMFAPSLYWTHPDYPLLLPGLTAATWRLIGSETMLVPAAYGVIFVLLTIAVVGSAVSALGGDDGGSISALVLLATPAYVLLAGEQMADAPLAMYFACTVVLRAFADVHRGARQPLLALAGLSAGSAAWTKNEGLLFVVALLTASVCERVVRRSQRPSLGDLRSLLIGATPMLLLLTAFKLSLAPGSDVLSGRGRVDRLLTPERYAFVASAFWDELLRFGKGALHPFLVAGVSLLAHGIRIRGLRQIPLALPFLPIAMLGGYFMIYVMTPNDLAWQVNMSLDRLLLQLWPACVFVLGVATAPASPGHAAARRSAMAQSPSDSGRARRRRRARPT